ncbi:Wzz/FepE/Etk N-terminal domain-containing protein [Emcibacteraceae bacterium]|nr:Wzz/FepE/Etk N-terminal domain-containing protein [Emcibacteraceae bacterium]
MHTSSEIDVLAITKKLMAKKIVLLSFSIVGFAIMAGISFMIPPTFKSTVTLALSDQFIDNTSGNLSALSSLVGIGGGAGSGDQSFAFYGIMTSNEIAGKFIQKNKLKPLLLEKMWDQKNGHWKDQEEPSLLEAILYFKDDVLQISKDTVTGFITVSIKSPEPELAKQWVTQFTVFVNDELAKRQKNQSNNNIVYLKEQLQVSEVLAIRQQLSEMLTKELTTLMLVNTSEEYAYQIIDSAFVPEIPDSPNKKTLALFGLLMGLLIGSVYILFKSRDA